MGDKIFDIYAPLQIEVLENGDIRLLRSFAYKLNESDFEGASEVIVVPENFVSKALNFYGFRLLKTAIGLKLSILHEYLCYLYHTYHKEYNITRKEADSILLEAMLNVGYSKIKAYSLYLFCCIITYLEN